MNLFGHRGAKGEAPENTLPGFIYATGIGLQAFELDVRLSADHELVVIHDSTVDRTTDGTGQVAGLTREQLARLDARADFLDWPATCFIPTLTEVFAVLPDTIRFEIEIKRDDVPRLEILVAKLIALIEEQAAPDRVTLSSFDPNALHIVRRLAPHLPRAYIGAFDTPQFLETSLELECAQVDVPLMTGSAAVVATAHANGLRVTGWPGDSPAQLRKLVEWEVDSITSNYPRIALPFLKEHTRG